MTSLFADLDRHAGRTALVQAKGALTYGAMLAAGDVVGKAAVQAVAGRPLAVVICRNDADCVAGYVGLMRAGAAVMLLHHAVLPDQLADILARFRPNLMFAPAAFSGAGRPVASLGGYDLTSFAAAPLDLHPDVALLLTTSGTTGSRNFVRLSGANLSANAASIADYLEIGADERAITTMPLSYSYGLSILHSHLLRGARLVLTEDSVISPGFWQLMKAEAVTSMGGVPFIYDALKKLRFAKMDLPALRTLTQAGGRMAPALVTEFAEICAASGRRLIVMYGQTEATARISWLPWEEIQRRPGSIGKAVPGGRLWLEDDTGAVITQPGASGELIYAGGNVSLGYAATAADLARGDDNNGILRTGDIAIADEEGFFSIVGRRKRFLKVFGHRVNLDDVERLLEQAGLECACAGTEDRLIVYTCADADDVKAVITGRTGLTIQMFRVVKVPAICRQESGKIDYRALEMAHGQA